MGWFDSDSDQAQAFEQLSGATETHHKAHLSHELIGGAAAFEAAKAWEEHKAANGKPDSHAKAKEFIAGAIGAFIDREVETRGLDFVDKEKAKHHAKQQAEEQLQNEY